MAQALLQHQFPHLLIHSAGLIDLTGQPSDEKAQICMQRMGLNINHHRARLMTANDVKNADVILVMSLQQQQHIEDIFPFSKGKVFRIGHWRHMDIADPYQKSQQAFDEACNTIEHCIQDWQIYFKA